MEQREKEAEEGRPHPPGSSRPSCSGLRWVVWVRWMLANLLSGVVGYVAAVLIAAILNGYNIFIGGVIGIIVGLAQWQVLRDYAAGIRAGPWVAFTAIG